MYYYLKSTLFGAKSGLIVGISQASTAVTDTELLSFFDVRRHLQVSFFTLLL